MAEKPLTKRLTALATVSALALSTTAPAWSAPPPIVPAVEPPGRVGRVARVAGTVSFHTADASQWSPAALNEPFTDGGAFWTEAGARADLQIASNRITLAPVTELDVGTLDNHLAALSEPQGEAYLGLRSVPAGNSYTVQTPRGTVQIAAAGRYDVVAGDTDHPTLVTVVDGSAQIVGADLSLQIGPRQTASISGTDTFQGSVGPIAQDAFLTAMLAEDRPPPHSTAPIPPIVQGMTGCEDLAAQGSWAQTAQYGAVWYPPVEAGWVPYRHGHWSYVAPWGWTWIDDAQWGFAPFHYGRWAEIDNRWGWIPVSPGAYADPVADYPVPVYAPALVSFVHVGGAAFAGAAVGSAAGVLAGGAVGWIPLGPREPYYPPYRSNLTYVRSVNATTIQNVGETINNTTINNNRALVQDFMNRGAATVVPVAAMVRSQSVAATARPLPADQFMHAQAQFRAPVVPAATTVGVTPAVARQFNFVAPARPAQAVPGPAINPALLRATPGRPLALPALRPAAAPGAVAPPAANAEAVVRPNGPARPEPAQRAPAAPGPEITHPGAPAPELRPVAPRPEPRAGGPAPEGPTRRAAASGEPRGSTGRARCGAPPTASASPARAPAIAPGTGGTSPPPAPRAPPQAYHPPPGPRPAALPRPAAPPPRPVAASPPRAAAPQPRLPAAQSQPAPRRGERR